MRRHNTVSMEEDVEKGTDDIPNILETAEECVIDEMSDTLVRELHNVLSKEKVRNMFRTTGDAIGAALLPRTGHFIYGILDLIKQHVQTIDSGKLNDKLVKLSVFVAQNSQYSYLRCKAFEVLAEMSSKPGAGQMPIQMVKELLEGSTWPNDRRDKISDQWTAMRKRALDAEQYLTDITYKSGIPAAATQIPLMESSKTTVSSSLAPTNHFVERIMSLLDSLEESLVCPFGTEDEENLSRIFRYYHGVVISFLSGPGECM